MANPLNLPISTAGASSPISIPVALSSGPAISAANPNINTMFGPFQVGGRGNDAAANFPTADKMLGLDGIAAVTSSPIVILAIAGAVAYILLRKK